MDISEIAYKYIDADLSIIPLRMHSKQPSIPWTDFQKSKPTHEQVESWFKNNPNGGIGIICGEINSLCVVDFDSTEDYENYKHLFPKTEYVSRTPKGYHFYYKTKKPIKRQIKWNSKNIDILGDNSYVVAYPSIVNKRKYEWMNGLDDFLWGFSFEKPSLDINDCIKNTRLKQSIYSTPKQIVSRGERNTTLASFVGGLIRQGFNLDDLQKKAEHLNADFDPPLSGIEVERTVNSVMKTHYNNNKLSIQQIEENKHSLEENVKEEIVEEKERELPLHLIENSGGIIKEAIDFITDTSACAHPWFSLGGTLSFIGAILGQKVQTETGLRTNLYCVAVGKSGSGKNAPFSRLPQLSSTGDVRDIIGADNIASGASILSWIGSEDKRRNAWLQMDEMNYIFEGMSNPSSPHFSTAELLTKLFSSTDRPTHKIYANSKDNIFIPWSHVSLYGATTPKSLWDKISTDMVSNGLIARMLFFVSDHYPMLPIDNKYKQNNKLSNKIKILSGINKQHQDIKMNGSIYRIPNPVIIPKNADATRYHKEKVQELHWKRVESTESAYEVQSILGRCHEHSAKIALIKQMSKDMTSKFVELDSIQWAWELVEFLSYNLIETINKNIFTNEVVKYKNKIIKGVSRHKTGCTLRDIQRNFARELTVSKLNDIMNSLLLSEELITIKDVAKNGREIKKFIAN